MANYFEEKLDNQQRMFVLRMIAEGFSPTKIKGQIKENFGICYSISAVQRLAKAAKHQPHIKKFYEDFLARIKEIPISHKRIRLDDIERERKRLVDLIKKTPTNTKQEKQLYIQLTGELRKLIESARDEMENKPYLVQNTLIDLSEKTDGELITRKQELIREFRRLNAGSAGGVDSDPEIPQPPNQSEPS